MKCHIYFQSTNGLLTQLLSNTGKQLESIDQMRQAEGRETVPGVSYVRKSLLKAMYALISKKPPTEFTKQCFIQQQKKVNEFFNNQHEKLKPVVLHSNMCCHGEKDRFYRIR